MNSSTSNSERRERAKTLLAVLAVMAVLIAGLELSARYVLIPHSRDFERFLSYPQRAVELCQKPGIRIAFVGNSATQRGIDPEQFLAPLPRQEPLPLQIDFFLADGSMINTWHYMVKQSFWDPEQNPDWIIIHFFNKNLQDGNSIEIGRLAQFFTTAKDWQELSSLDLPTLNERAEFTLSTFWSTFAIRSRLKKRALQALVPDYQEFAEKLQSENYHHENPRESLTPPVVTHKALERFLALARKGKTRLIFVAFPLQRSDQGQPYPLHPDAEKRIREAGMDLIDLRCVDALNKDHYEDDIHLTHAGATIYTRCLLQAVLPRLQEDTERFPGQRVGKRHLLDHGGG